MWVKPTYDFCPGRSSIVTFPPAASVITPTCAAALQTDCRRCRRSCPRAAARSCRRTGRRRGTATPLWPRWSSASASQPPPPIFTPALPPPFSAATTTKLPLHWPKARALDAVPRRRGVRVLPRPDLDRDRAAVGRRDLARRGRRRCRPSCRRCRRRCRRSSPGLPSAGQTNSSRFPFCPRKVVAFAAQSTPGGRRDGERRAPAGPPGAARVVNEIAASASSRTAVAAPRLT